MTDPLPRDSDLVPTHTPRGVDPVKQAEALRELRDLELDRRAGTEARDDFILANSLSLSLSRPDMARAVGLSRARVDQLIAERAQTLGERCTAELRARTRRHLP